MLEDPVQGQRIKVVIDGVTDSAGTAYDGLLGKHSHQYCSCSAALADSYSDYYHILSSDGWYGYYFKQWIPCTVHANWLNIFLEIYVKFRAKEIYVACRIFTARVIFLLIFFFTLFSKRNTFFITLIITNVCIAIELILAVAFNPIRFWVPEFKQ